ncbi:MAG TPA: Calx-beta domain-containing protein, partial [Pyrinomonadaceae bacterium]|nr:Calx-beta domain-containing protein [Pyrinomonadaceae bacterium]
GARTTEVPLHPTISGDGKRIAFTTRRTVTGFSNSDASVELYTYDIPTTSFARVTSAPAEADCFDGSSQVCEVVSSLNDDGSIIAFNFPRALSGSVAAGLENKPEIYATETALRPPFGTLTSILNQASLGHEPSPTKAVAPESIAAALGAALANTTQQSRKLPNGTFPTNVAGTTVTVNGRTAQIIFVSPDRVQFLMPGQTEVGNAEVVITNADGFASLGIVPVLRTAPGIFTKTGDGIGEGVILDSDTSQSGTFDPTSGNLRISVFGTGLRDALHTAVNIAGRIVTPEVNIPSTEMPGLDEVRVRVPTDLRGIGTVSLAITADGRESNPVTVPFTGDPARNILINEVLADPPSGIAGDANHDGVRDGTQDEFVELVNGTSNEAISLSNWTIRTRPAGSTTETTRFTFASGTSLPAGAAIVVFGGGNFNPSHPVFGCAQVVKATTSAGLSLTNSGLTVLVRDGAGNLITQFSYGGSTGLDGGNSQSLTRSPDITGGFMQHRAAAGDNGGSYSPGLRLNGTPFGFCPGALTTVTIAPLASTVTVGQTTQFTAQALDQYGRTMTNATINFASDNPNVTTIESVTMDSSTGVGTATLKARNPGPVHITASATNGAATVNSGQATLTVTGPSLSINDVNQNEGDSGTTTFTFTVTLSTPAPVPVTFDIASQDNTATTTNNDYVARSLTGQTIAAGLQTYTFDVTVNGDVNLEPTETFFVNVSNVSGASLSDAQGAGTIVTDDLAKLSVNDVSLLEEDFGRTTFTFTVTSSLPAPSGGISFDISTQNGTAVSNSDYIARSSLTSQSIAEGQTSYTFDVSVNGDTLVEPNETFFVNISNVSANAAIDDGQGQGTIQNDDAAALVISQVYGGGNNSGATFQNDFIEIFNRGTTTVDFAVTPYAVQYAGVGSNFGGTKTNLTTGSIVPGKHFLVQESGGTSNGAPLPTPDAVGTIAMGNTSGKVALVVGTTALPASTCPGDDGSTPFNPIDGTVADLVGYGSTAGTSGHCYEGSGPAAAPSNTTADLRKAGGCTDTNDNAVDSFVATASPRNTSSSANNCSGVGTPALSINDVMVAEGNNGTTTATFTVNLSFPPQGSDVTFDIATANGSATTANNDYVAKSLLAQVIPAGQTTYTFTVTVSSDVIVEPDETFLVNVTNVSGATTSDAQGQGTIQNDDQPSLSINDVTMNEGNSGTTTFTFTVTLSAPAPGTVSFDIATQDDTATAADNDYIARVLRGQTITAGSLTYIFAVTVNGDLNIESNERFFVKVTNVSGASVSSSQGVGNIQNDDSPTLSINDVTQTEGNAGTSTFTFAVTSSLPAPAGGINFTVNTAAGTASAGSDYVTITNASGSILAGSSSTIIDVTVNGDQIVEPNETFFANLSNATNATVVDGQGLGTITNDDTPLLVISQVYGGGGNSGAAYQNDFVELFNRGTSTIDFAVTPYSVQYSSAAGSFSSANKADLLSGNVAPGRYFLVKLASGGTVGQNFAADITNTAINMSATDGKVAIVLGTIVATTSSGCPTNVTVVDLLGYGLANCAEGNATAALSPTKVDSRNNQCTDTGNNGLDFIVITVNVSSALPRNSSSPIATCP